MQLKMVSPLILFTVALLCTAGIARSKGVLQTPRRLLIERGHSAHMDCSHDLGGQFFHMHWYQQLPGESMKLVVYTVPYSKPDFGDFSEDKFSANKTDAESGSFTVKNVRPGDNGVYFCVVSSRPAYFGSGTKLTVLEYDVTQPRVNILQPSSNECQDKTDRKNKKTLVCVASDFYPDHVSVSWQIEGVAVTDGVATDSAALRDGRFYSITSRLRVMARMWHTPGKKFTCIVSFYNGSSTSDHSDTVFGIKGPGEGMTREKYVTITQTAKFSYGVFIAKSSLYGVFVLVLVWKLQGSSGKQ